MGIVTVFDNIQKMKPWVRWALILIGASLLLTPWLGWQQAFRLVVGGFYVLFAPGLALTAGFFKGQTIHPLERWVLSFGLSVVLLPVIMVNFQFLGIALNEWTILAVVTGLVVVGLGLAKVRTA